MSVHPVPARAFVRHLIFCHQKGAEAFVETSQYTAISRKVVGKNVYAIIPKGYGKGYDQFTVAYTVAVEPTFVAFL